MVQLIELSPVLVQVGVEMIVHRNPHGCEFELLMDVVSVSAEGQQWNNTKPNPSVKLLPLRPLHA